MKITEYYLIEHNEWTVFVNDVNKWINDGWTPLGGVCRAIGSSDELCYIQAMVKYE
jgi:hypothetical protein